MKRYILSNYESIGALRADMTADLNALLADEDNPTPVRSSKYGEGEILEVGHEIEALGKSDITVDVSFAEGIKTFALKACSDNGLVILPEDKKHVVDNAFVDYYAAYAEHKAKADEEFRLLQERSARAIELHKKKIAEHKAAKEAKEAAEKLAKKQAESERKFRMAISDRTRLEADPVEQLKAITTSVHAVVPDHLEKYFVSAFGNAPHKTVDHQRKTSGGYSMKFGATFTITVSDEKLIPAEFQQYFKGNKACSVQFVSNLVRNYGFEFKPAK